MAEAASRASGASCDWWRSRAELSKNSSPWHVKLVTYVTDTEFGKELHVVPALRFAVLECVGVTLAAQFVEYNGFTSLTGAVEFHF